MGVMRGVCELSPFLASAVTGSARWKCLVY